MHRHLWIVPMIVAVIAIAGCSGEGPDVCGGRVTCTMTAPAADAEIYQGTTVTITVTATATEGVNRVVFKIDGQTVGTDTNEPYSYPWETADASLGEHTITATVYDNSDPERSCSCTRTVTIVQPPTEPPTVSIDSPDDGDTVQGNFDVVVSAAAQEEGATITEIEITLDGISQTVTGDSGTVEFESTQVANGEHTITAVAIDSLDVTASASITVTVDNFTVRVQSVTVAAGGNTTVSINMSDTTGVAGFQMTINYDPQALRVVGGDAGVQKGAAVPAGALLMPNTATAGVITAAVAGTTNFNAAEQEILKIQFTAIGGAGPTTVDIDDTGGAPTPLGFSDNTGSSIEPAPIAVDGTVTIQ